MARSVFVSFFLVISGLGRSLELGRSSCSQLPGRPALPARDRQALGGSAACFLSDISGWRAAALYPLAGGGRESGAAHLDLLGPPGRCSGCWPHDGEVAGGGGFLFSDIAVRGDDGARAIGATDAAEVPGRRRRPPGSNAALKGSTACSLSDISGWRAGVLYPLAGGGRDSGAAHLAIKGNKAIVDQPPLLEPLYEESESNERLRVSNWIVDRL